VEQRGDSVIVNCSDSDVVARYFLTSTAARDIEVSSQNLEAAFVALTADTAMPMASGARA
jgi:ABC-2 type transport system ATP-binding protein